MAILIADRKEEQTMHSSLFIANRFIDLATQNGRQLTHMQVQKLVYFANAVTLANTGGDTSLIRESFFAYPFGPVEKRLYDRLRFFRRNPVRLITNIQEEELTQEEANVISSVYNTLGHMTAAELSRLSHVPGGPWDQIWNHTGEFEEIPNQLIADFYAS